VLPGPSRLPLLLLPLLVACAGPPDPPVAAPPADSPPAAPAPADSAVKAAAPAATEATVSPPVTLEQFRAAFPVGTKIRLLIAAKGKPTEEQRWTWVKADNDGCVIATTVHDEKGTLIRDEGTNASKWTELLSHGSFPAAKTERSDSSIEVPAGRFETWLFTVRDQAKDGTPLVKRYHFAKTMPGPPVLFTIEGAGVEIFRMTMLERTGKAGGQ
jgi:hypothetical protein